MHAEIESLGNKARTTEKSPDSELFSGTEMDI